MMTKESDLVAIVNRLSAMRKDGSAEVQVRQFDAFGVNVATVLFDQPSQTFALTIGRDNRRFAFDDINLVAIDIYEAMQDFKETF
jgi:uncharacterized protein YkuJ